MFIVILWLGLSLLVGIVGKDRTVGFWIAFFASLILSPLIGLIIVLLSGKDKRAQETRKYIACIEAAKKAEFKGQLETAIDLFMDALFYLKDNYSNADAQQRQLTENIQAKITSLKAKLGASKLD
jgi:hypothetical protein